MPRSELRAFTIAVSIRPFPAPKGWDEGELIRVSSSPPAHFPGTPPNRCMLQAVIPPLNTRL